MANQDHLDRLLKSVGSIEGMWNRWRQQNPHIQPDLSDLSEDTSPLVDAKLAYADLRNAIFTNTNLRGVDLRGAELGKAKLDGVQFEETDLTGADLREASLRGAYFHKTKGLANERREQSPDIESDLSDHIYKAPSLAGATLAHADLRNAIFIDTDLRGADLRGAKLGRAKLDGIQFEETDLAGADLREASLRDADLREAKGLSGEQLAGTDLKDAALPDPIQKERIHQFDEKLERIEKASYNLQTLFFALLAACLYCWLTIIATTHLQLVTDSISSPLPVIGTEISIINFYRGMPCFLLVFYIFFHLHSQRLWDMLADLPAVFPDGTRLDQRGHPRHVSGFVRARSSLLKQDSPPGDSLYGWLFIFLTWFNVPLTLFGFWWSFLPRRDIHGDIVIVSLTVIITITVAFGLWSYNCAVTALQRENRIEWTNRTLFMKLSYFISMFTIVFIGIAGSIICKKLYDIFYLEQKINFTAKELYILLLCGSLTMYFRIPSYGRMVAKSKKIKNGIDISIATTGAIFVILGLILIILNNGSPKNSGWIPLILVIVTMMMGLPIFRHYLMSFWWWIRDIDNKELRALRSNSGKFISSNHEERRYLRRINLNMKAVPVVAFSLSLLFLIKITQNPVCWHGDQEVDWRKKERRELDSILCYPVANLKRQEIAIKSPNWPGMKDGDDLRLVAGGILKNANLQYASANKAFFAKTDLDGANLQKAALQYADFRKAQLRKADLSGAYLHWSKLRDADLREAVFKNANLYEANLHSAHLSIFTDCHEGSLRQAVLEEADLRRVVLTKASLHGANLKNADLKNANLDGAQLSGADLSGAKLQSVSLQGANLGQRCVTSVCDDDQNDNCNNNSDSTTLTRFEITECSLENLRSEKLTSDVLEKLEVIKNQKFTAEEEFLRILESKIGKELTVQHKSAILKHAKKLFNFNPNKKSTYLSGADLSGANLHKANLLGAKLMKVNLHGAILYEANLYGADLQEAKHLLPTQLKDACIYESTKLPDTEDFKRIDKEKRRKGCDILWNKINMNFAKKDDLETKSAQSHNQ